ncbi:hypothetical protein HGQ98_34415, partial [Achromobacter ruhlandii]|nr:hypothetical protein [Achromobacter ruhlandii]
MSGEGGGGGTWGGGWGGWWGGGGGRSWGGGGGGTGGGGAGGGGEGGGGGGGGAAGDNQSAPRAGSDSDRTDERGVVGGNRLVNGSVRVGEPLTGVSSSGRAMGAGGVSVTGAKGG